MRKWHRWLVLFFGVFLIWIAGTGVAMQLTELLGEEEQEGPPPAAAQAQAAPAPVQRSEAPQSSQAPKPEREEDLHHFLQRLHSGEKFGPVGVVINTLSGLALLFFSFSGLWMYIQMWRNRAKRSLKPGWFWN